MGILEHHVGKKLALVGVMSWRTERPHLPTGLSKALTRELMSQEMTAIDERIQDAALFTEVVDGGFDHFANKAMRFKKWLSC
jgi:hypothetical protein